MELVLDSTELEIRREEVAGFIEANVVPVRRLLEEGSLEVLDEEVREEAENFEIRDVQLDAWAALWDARHDGSDRALVHLATGLGKTSVAVFDVIKFREEFIEEHGREPRVLFTCHQNEIIEQGAERFKAFIPNASQGFFTGAEKTRDANITFATLQALHRSLDTFDPQEFDYIVYDEAHHSRAETFEEVVNYFDPKFQLALTATPNRLDQLDIRELFGEEVYSKGLADALAEELLVRPDYHIVLDDAMKEAIASDFAPKSLKELRALLEVWPRNEQIAKNVKSEMKKLGLELGDAKTIVFCQDIMHTEDMAWLLDGEAYHSDIPSSRRRELLQQFRDGDLQTICVRDMFNEGIDIPDAELLVFLRSTSSTTIFEQQLGRGLRKHEGKDKVSILDFAANIERILMIKELADEVNRLMPNSLQGGEAIQTLDESATEEVASVVQMADTQFNFDKVSIDLLKKYNVLTDAAPTGYMSFHVFAKAIKSTPDYIAKVVGDIDSLLEMHRYGKRPGLGLSPDAQAQILAMPEFQVEDAPEGHQTLAKLNREWKISAPRLLELIETIDVPIEIHRYVSGRRAIPGLSAEAQATVINHPDFIPPIPEDYISVPGLATQLKISKKVLQDLMETHDISSETHRHYTYVVESLSPAAQEKLLDLDEVQEMGGGKAPEGHVGISMFAKDHHKGTRAVRKLMKENGIEARQVRKGKKLITTLSSEAQNKLLQLFEAQESVEEAPEGYVSMKSFYKARGIERLKVMAAIEKHGLELPTYKFTGKNGSWRRGVALSPEVQELLSNDPELQKIELAPEGYKSMVQMSKELDRNGTTLKQWIDENDIPYTKHKYGRLPARSFSPEAQQRLRALSATIGRRNRKSKKPSN